MDSVIKILFLGFTLIVIDVLGLHDFFLSVHGSLKAANSLAQALAHLRKSLGAEDQKYNCEYYNQFLSTYAKHKKNVLSCKRFWWLKKLRLSTTKACGLVIV